MRTLVLALSLVPVLASCSSTSAPPAPDPARSWPEDAPLVFEGLVLSSSGRAARVEIERVFRGDSLAGFEGRTVDVALADGSDAAAGELVIFFARPESGSGLRALELGHVPATHENVRHASGLVRRGARADLAREIGAAELVVVAEVWTPVAVHLERRHGPAPDPDPQWSAVQLRVRSVERGSLDGDELVVAYPAAVDPPYGDVPKPRVGDTGVWLLHRARPEGFREPAWMPLARLDPARLEAVRRLAP